jgi:hypothetical protein
MSIKGPVYCLWYLDNNCGIVLAGALVNPRPKMWYKAWQEMLQGVRLVMSRVDRYGGADGLMVGISYRSSSGSTMGSEWVGCLAPAGVFLGFQVGLGHRLWMWVWGAAGVMAWMLVRMASTLGGGVVGGRLLLRVGSRLVGWFTNEHVGWRAGGFSCRLLGGRLGGGTRGLQLLATTVSSLSSSSARMLKGLLLQVWRWWTSGMVLMTLGAVILFATLGGGADTTLAVGATTLRDGSSSGASCCPVMMAVRF